MTKEHYNELGRLWRLFNEVQSWEGEDFTAGKAKVCAYIAKAAYLHIPEWEIKNANRVNLIPCRAYHDMIRSREFVNSKTILGNYDIDEVFSVETETFIAVGYKFRKVIFISIRGTENLYDWQTNVDVRKVLYGCCMNRYVEIHKGFHDALIPNIQKIYDGLESANINEKTLIYIVGHSLGGALAAILNTQMICRSEFTRQIRGCYTFGMPRIGRQVLHICPMPFAIKNEDDIVTELPPKILGYSDFGDRYFIRNGKLTSKDPKASIFKRLLSVIKLSCIRNHKIESYIESLEKC